MQTVFTDDGKAHYFPDDASADDIGTAMRSLPAPAPAEPQEHGGGWGQELAIAGASMLPYAAGMAFPPLEAAAPLLSAGINSGLRYALQGQHEGNQSIAPNILTALAGMVPGGGMAANAAKMGLGAALGRGINQAAGIEESTPGQYAMDVAVPAAIGVPGSLGLAAVRNMTRALPGVQKVAERESWKADNQTLKDLAPFTSSEQLYADVANKRGGVVLDAVNTRNAQDVLARNEDILGRYFPSLVKAKEERLGLYGTSQPSRTVTGDIGFGGQEHVVPAVDQIHDVPFEAMQNGIKRINGMIGVAKNGGDMEHVGALKALCAAMQRDIDESPLAEDLRLAAQAHRKEMALTDLAEATKAARTTVGGVEALSPKQMLNGYLDLSTMPTRNGVQPDTFFTQSFTPEELSRLDSFYRQLDREAESLPSGRLYFFNATLGGALGSSLGYGLGGYPGGVVGGGLGMAVPEMLSRVALNPTASKMLLGLAKAGQGRISRESLQGIIQAAEQFQTVEQPKVEIELERQE